MKYTTVPGENKRKTSKIPSTSTAMHPGKPRGSARG
jgi:hypothetical protein